MAKPRSPVADYAVYLLVRVLVCLLQSLSLEIGRRIAHGLAWLAYHLDRRHREVAKENLRQAFPCRYTEAEIDVLVRDVYRHFFEVVIDMVHLPRKLQPGNWKRHLAGKELGPLLAAMLSGRPVLIVTGHFGNWEMAGYAMAMLGFQSYAVARPLDNPHLDRFLRQFRERTGQTLLNKKGDLDRIEQILQSGGTICTLADQDAGQRGLFVEFFGRPASTHKAIALLALKHHAAVAVAGIRKVGEPLRFEAHVTDVIPPKAFETMANPVRELTQRFTSALERLARIDLRQYFWLHRRWKHQPQERRRSAA